MSLRRLLIVTSACAAALAANAASAANLYLKAGNFYGPGNKGVQPFNNAEVRNMVLTGPLTGIIPFFNNGALSPNVIAEVRQGGVIDGRTSDGRLINENVDTGLHLLLHDHETGESANIAVVAIGEESFGPDEKGNLSFETNVVADPGQAHQIRPLTVTFTTGAARVPYSMKTQQGLAGGHDEAGPFKSGHTLIGRIGDFDQDGLLDGELVLAGNAPLDLIVALGDPIAQRRPWISDIPVPPGLSALLIVNGIVRNFPEPLMEVLGQGNAPQAVEYGFDINARLNSALHNLSAVLATQSASHDQRRRARAARLFIRIARFEIEQGLDALARPHADRHSFKAGAAAMRRGLKDLAIALSHLAPELPQMPAFSDQNLNL